MYLVTDKNTHQEFFVATLDAAKDKCYELYPTGVCVRPMVNSEFWLWGSNGYTDVTIDGPRRVALLGLDK